MKGREVKGRRDPLDLLLRNNFLSLRHCIPPNGRVWRVRKSYSRRLLNVFTDSGPIAVNHGVVVGNQRISVDSVSVVVCPEDELGSRVVG